jgi:hypothetical protein
MADVNLSVVRESPAQHMDHRIKDLNTVGLTQSLSGG